MFDLGICISKNNGTPTWAIYHKSLAWTQQAILDRMPWVTNRRDWSQGFTIGLDTSQRFFVCPDLSFLSEITKNFRTLLWAHQSHFQGVGRDVPQPTYPYGKFLHKPYIIGIHGFFHPQESHPRTPAFNTMGPTRTLGKPPILVPWHLFKASNYKRNLSGFPNPWLTLNPDWLMTGFLYWLIAIPIKVVSTIFCINQPTRMNWTLLILSDNSPPKPPPPPPPPQEASKFHLVRSCLREDFQNFQLLLQFRLTTRHFNSMEVPALWAP